MTPTQSPEPWLGRTPAELLVAAWLAGYSSLQTRRTYRAMIRSWFDWCIVCGVEPLSARRAHVELWQRGLEQHGYAVRTIALKLGAVASFYRYCEQEDLIGRTPLAGVRRPRVERLSPRGALTRGQVHDLLAGAERRPSLWAVLCSGPQRAAHRHSWTTLAIDAGVSQDQIQHDAGWADARMVSYYTHGRDQALRATTHSVAAFVFSAA